MPPKFWQGHPHIQTRYIGSSSPTHSKKKTCINTLEIDHVLFSSNFTKRITDWKASMKTMDKNWSIPLTIRSKNMSCSLRDQRGWDNNNNNRKKELNVFSCKSIELINTKNYTNIIKNGLLLDFLEIPKQRNKN